MKILAIGIIYPFLACSDYTLEQRSMADQFLQQATAEVDVLLVVDDSATMEPHQERLGQRFGLFHSWLLSAQVDYRIGVMSTSMTPARPVSEACQSQALYHGGNLTADWITRETTDSDRVFLSAVSVGTCGNPTEMPLLVSAHATETLELRASADLSVVILTDEDDGSPGSVYHYLQRMQSLQPRRDYLRISAMAVVDPNLCPDLHAQSRSAPRVTAAVNSTGGVLIDLCGDDFDGGLEELSMNSARLRRFFELKSRPNPKSIVVTVNGSPAMCVSNEGWEYHLKNGKPTIAFDSPPSLGSVVAVEYEPGSGEPRLRCGDI